MRYTGLVAKTNGERRIYSESFGPEFVVAVVNGWSTTARRTAGEADLPFPSFARLAAERGVDAVELGVRLTDRDLVRVADALHPVFAAPSDAETVERLNSLLARTNPSPRLLSADGEVVEAWAARGGADGLLSGCALALRHHLATSGDGRRMGVCTGVECADVFVDASPTGHKRFCDVQCQNRARVAAFRRRQRARR
jgi:predicted RNA-binding Zn ribbon-like protein